MGQMWETEMLDFFSSMRGDEAKEVCPQIHLVQVPVARGKADLNSYREAGSEVCDILVCGQSTVCVMVANSERVLDGNSSFFIGGFNSC